MLAWIFCTGPRRLQRANCGQSSCSVMQLTTLSGRHPLSGAVIANLNPAFADELGFDPTERGVVVNALRDGSVAARLGLEPGDMLISINKRPIESVAQLQQLLATTPPPWVVSIKRGDKLLPTPPLRG